MVFYRRQKGDEVEMQVLRGSQELPLTVAVDEQEDDDDFLRDMVTPERNLVKRLGILCIEIDPKISNLLPGLRRPGGLIVAAKSESGQGRYIDLQQGDVIHAVNNVAVSSLEAFRGLVYGLKPGAAVALLIEREGSYRYVGFEIQ